ncbi:MAG: hypothetical protein IOD01_16345 [Rhodobacter sp.]|nr:hypothetical protein [Rhodobacter sp.]
MITQTPLDPRSSWQDRSCAPCVSAPDGGDEDRRRYPFIAAFPACVCAGRGIEQRLTPPMHPQTNATVARVTDRIGDILQSPRVHSGADPAQTIPRCIHRTNSRFPQAARKGSMPIAAPRDRHHLRPELFSKQVCNGAVCHRF